MRVFIRSALFLVLLTYLHPYIGGISSLLQFFIVIFNILIYLIAKQSDETRLKNMDNELVKTEKVTH